jgi:hypothetical protein
VWAEWYRHLAEQAVPPLVQMPRDLWTWALDVEVADLSTVERLAAVGLPLPQPGQRTWPAFQRVGERLWKDGWPGLLAPSAARPQAFEYSSVGLPLAKNDRPSEDRLAKAVGKRPFNVLGYVLAVIDCLSSSLRWTPGSRRHRSCCRQSVAGRDASRRTGRGRLK